MIFPESELSTYLGFFVPGGQVEPLLDRIAEASSEFEEMDLIGFLHLAQRELELTGDVNRNDAAVVLIEELQLPLAEAAAVLEETPAATAARLQSAWADIPDHGTGPLPNLLRDGLIMLEDGLELDDELVLDPALSIISPAPPTPRTPGVPAAHTPVREAAPAVEPTIEPEPVVEMAEPVEAWPEPDAVDELPVEAVEPAEPVHEVVELPIAAVPEPPAVEAPEDAGPFDSDVFAYGEDGAGEHAVVLDEDLEVPSAVNPYAALTPESLEGSSQSFPWDPYDHSQPVTAASLLDLEEDPALTQGPSAPITHVTGRIPVAEILDGEADDIAAFPSHHVASDLPMQTPEAQEAEALAAMLIDATTRGDELVYEHTPDHLQAHGVPEAHEPAEPHASAAPFGEPEAHEPPEGFWVEDPGVEPEAVLVEANGPMSEPAAPDVMDAFGNGHSQPEPAVFIADEPGMARPVAAEAEMYTGEDTAFWDMSGEWPEAVEPEAVEPEAVHAQPEAATPEASEAQPILAQPGQPPRRAITPYWMIGQPRTADQPPAQQTPQIPYDQAELVDEPTAQWSFEADMESAGPWAQPAQRTPNRPENDDEDTQQFPVMDLLAQVAAGNTEAAIGLNLLPDQVIPPSVEQFLEDLHGAWIAGGNDVLQRPVSDVPLGGRIELAEPPAPVPPPQRLRPVASGAELTNDEAVEATYEEEYEPEPPAVPVPTAVWIPGMADRAFRSTPWHQIEDEDSDEDATPDLHGFGASTYTPARPVVVRQSPAEKIGEADVAAFMAGGPADAPDWDGIDEGTWAHADYGPKRPKANRIGQISGLIAVALAAGVVYLYLTWAPIQSAITALRLPVHPLVVVGAIVGVLGIGGLSMFIGSSIPKQPKKVKVVRRRRKRTSGDDADVLEDEAGEGTQDAGYAEDAHAGEVPGREVVTDVWEEEFSDGN